MIDVKLSFHPAEKPALDTRSDNAPLARLLTAVIAGALHDSITYVQKRPARVASATTAEERRAVVAEAKRTRTQIDRLTAERLRVGYLTAREIGKDITVLRHHLANLGAKLDRMRRDAKNGRSQHRDTFRALAIRDDAREWFRSTNEAMPASDGSGVNFWWAVNTLNEITNANLPHPSRWLPYLESIWQAVDGGSRDGRMALNFLNLAASAAA